MRDHAIRCVLVLLVPVCLAWIGCSSSGGGDPDGGVDAGGLPEGLPFALTRPAVGDPPDSSEIAAFTSKVTGFWRSIDYFRWCSWHSHGLHPSYDSDMPDYKVWWQDTLARKEGDTVTFVHYGGADNIMIRTPKVLAQALSGYLVTGDPLLRQLVVDYCHGIVALFQGLEFGSENPVEPYVTARAIFTHNHEYTTDDGRSVAVDYDPVKQESYDWNAHTVPNPDNPYFGDIWVRNMRSKDDVPHMFRVAPLLMRAVQDAPDEDVRQAAGLAVEYLTGFAKDIVDSGYQIRTKEAGQTYVPMEEENPDQVKDLASFVSFEEYIPNAECDPKLVSALLAYGEELGNDCGNGINVSYESAATITHYFNYAIVRYFHLAAITTALTLSKDRLAERLLDGLVERVDIMMADDEERVEHLEWDADASSFLLASAASGLPLTAAEARLIQTQLSASVDHFQDWPNWDLWDPSVPDGEYDYKPSRDGPDYKVVRPEELTFLLHYCYSPWRNPAGVDLVDCEVVLDPTRWGE